jgi:hypothetical protein
MREAWVTVATFTLPSPAHLAKARLEAEGITVSIADENIAVTAPHYAPAVGGIKLRVRRQNAQKAITILRQEPLTTESILEEMSDEDEEDARRCPRCNSSHVDYQKFPHRLAFISALVIGILLAMRTGKWYWLVLALAPTVVKKSWGCKECGYQWKAR